MWDPISGWNDTIIKEVLVAGYSKIYCMGGLGGFKGADGINPMEIQIWVGEGNRPWFEVHYFKKGISPIGKIRTVIPESPGHPDAILDACIAFFPEYFETCPALPAVKQKLRNQDNLDFDLERDRVPKKWSELREQARPLFERLPIFQAILEPLKTPRAQ